MSKLARILRLVALGVGIAVLPTLAVAQERSSLRVPTIAASAAATADWATTYYALKNFELREVNPLLSPMQHRPGPMISAGAAIDVGLVSAWNLTVGRKNERLAATGLWAMAAFRTYLAIHNMRNTRRVARRIMPADRAATHAVPVTCAVPLSVQACAAANRTAQ